MHQAEKELVKAMRKIAKWYRIETMYQVLPTGSILKLNSDSQMTPTIGIVGDQIVGAQDDYDIFIDLLGYEGQVERVLFDPTKAKFILDAGWSGKFWRKPTKGQIENEEDFVVDAIAVRLPVKIAALAVVLIAIVERESRRRLKQTLLKPLKRKAKK